MGQEVTATDGNQTVTSTTATQEEVNASVGLDAEGKAVVSKEKEAETPVAPEKAAETPSVPETEEETEQEAGAEVEKKKGKGGFQRKIDKLTARADRLEAELEAERARKEEKPESVTKKVEGEPKPDDYETTEAYIKAQARWEVRQEFAEQKAAEEVAAQEAKDREKLDTYAKRTNEAKNKYDDWDDVYESLGEATIPQSVQLALVEMENGPDVVYHLAKNPEVLERLNSMSPLSAVVEVGRIAAGFSTSKSESNAPEKRTLSTVPAPIKPVGGAATKSAVPLGDLSPNDYIKARKAGRTA